MTAEDKYIHTRLLSILIRTTYALQEQNVELGIDGSEAEALINWSVANAKIKELNTTRRELLSQPRTEQTYQQIEKIYNDVQSYQTDKKSAEVTLKIKSEDYSSPSELEKYIIFKIGQKIFDLNFDVRNFNNEYMSLIGWFSASEKIKEMNKQLSTLYALSKSQKHEQTSNNNTKQLYELKLNKYVLEIEKYNHAKSINNYAKLNNLNDCPIKCVSPKPPQKPRQNKQQKHTISNSEISESSCQNHIKKIR